MKTINYCIILFILLPANKYFVHAQNKQEKHFYSISAGGLLAGNVMASYEIDFPANETVDIKNSFSPLIKIEYDYIVQKKLSIGANLNFAKFNISDILFEGESIKTGNEVNLGTWDEREHVIPLDDIKMLELNGSIKYHFVLNPNMKLKTCLYLGYRRTFSSSQDAREQGVVLNYNATLQYQIKPGKYILSDLGFFAQPYGGVEHVGYVKSFGVPYFSIGFGMML